MSVKEYKLYKETDVVPWYKSDVVKKFWETNPTYQQENIRDQQVISILMWMSIVTVTYFVFGLFIGGVLW